MITVQKVEDLVVLQVYVVVIVLYYASLPRMPILEPLDNHAK